MKDTITRFVVGGTFQTRSVCAHNCVISVTIESRTACFVRTTEGQRFKVARSEVAGGEVETIRPWGSFSMAPTITAEKRDPQLKADWE